MRQTGKGPANELWYVWMQLGEATNMHFINDEVAPFNARTPWELKRFRRFNNRFWNKGRAIDIVCRGAMDSRIEQTCVEHEWPVEPRCERINQQFSAIETMSALRLEAAVRAQSVMRAGSNARDMTVKHIA